MLRSILKVSFSLLINAQNAVVIKNHFKSMQPTQTGPIKAVLDTTKLLKLANIQQLFEHFRQLSSPELFMKVLSKVVPAVVVSYPLNSHPWEFFCATIAQTCLFLPYSDMSPSFILAMAFALGRHYMADVESTPLSCHYVISLILLITFALLSAVFEAYQSTTKLCSAILSAILSDDFKASLALVQSQNGKLEILRANFHLLMLTGQEESGKLQDFFESQDVWQKLEAALNRPESHTNEPEIFFTFNARNKFVKAGIRLIQLGSGLGLIQVHEYKRDDRLMSNDNLSSSSCGSNLADDGRSLI